VTEGFREMGVVGMMRLSAVENLSSPCIVHGCSPPAAAIRRSGASSTGSQRMIICVGGIKAAGSRLAVCEGRKFDAAVPYTVS